MRENDERDHRRAFEAAYGAHYWQVVAYAERRLGTGSVSDAARDAAQETFAVAWRRRGELPETPLPWLYAVAANIVRNATRGDRRRNQLTRRLHAVPDAPGAEPRPVDATFAEPIAADPTGDADPVRRALAGLTAADQEVLRLAAWEGLAPADIGRVLGCSPNTAAARLSRAKKRLRVALGAAQSPHESGHDSPVTLNDQEVRRA